MATYAYRDIARKEIIYASNAVKEDRDKIFFCPNVFCTAKLHICAVDGSKKAYFRATQSQFPHVPKCAFSASSREFDAEEFDECAVAGKWDKSGMFNCFISDICSRKQVALIK